MDFSLDGNRRLITTAPAGGLSLAVTSAGMTLSLDTWTHDALHVCAQAMAASGDKGVPVVLACSGPEALAWALLYCGYGTGDPYDRCREWVEDRAGCAVDEDEAHWIMVRGMLWP